MKSKIIIFGCGGHARSVADVILSNKTHLISCFIDDNARDKETIFGYDVKKTITLDQSDVCIVAIGNNTKRKVIFDSIDRNHIFSVISEFSYDSPLSMIYSGVFVGNQCHIGPKAVIGENTIINTASIIEHEVIVGKHCHIAPNVTVCGKTTIGDLCFIGAGTVVIPDISICSNVQIGAGSVVVNDIKTSGIYVGRPVRKIK